MTPVETDNLLISDILQGSKLAFKQLYHRYAKRHMLTCLRYMKTKTDAEDVLQEAFIKVFKDLKQYDSNKALFVTWSNKVVVNTCLMTLRKKSVFKAVDNIRDISENVTVEPDAIDHLGLQDLTLLIGQLPEGYRTVFNMYVIDGFKHNEIADLLSISVNTSKTQLRKARLALQNMIKSREYPLSVQYVSR